MLLQLSVLKYISGGLETLHHNVLRMKKLRNFIFSSTTYTIILKKFQK